MCLWGNGMQRIAVCCEGADQCIHTKVEHQTEPQAISPFRTTLEGLLSQGPPAASVHHYGQLKEEPRFPLARREGTHVQAGWRRLGSRLSASLPPLPPPLLTSCLHSCLCLSPWGEPRAFSNSLSINSLVALPPTHFPLPLLLFPSWLSAFPQACRLSLVLI